MREQEVFDKAIQFMRDIGIEVEFKQIESTACFLPGLLIENGKIAIDLNKLKYPGDVLHEAAHIAVVPEAERAGLNGVDIEKRSNAPAEEMMCIAWSYAACHRLNIDPHFVFHDDGYKGGGSSIVENFNSGKYVGVPMLEWLGMTSSVGNNKYPEMKSWMRTSELPAFNS